MKLPHYHHPEFENYFKELNLSMEKGHIFAMQKNGFYQKVGQGMAR